MAANFQDLTKPPLSRDGQIPWNGSRRRLNKDPKRVLPSIVQVCAMRERRINNHREKVEKYFTDLNAHVYDPYFGTHMAVGSSDGYLNIISEISTGSPTVRQNLSIAADRSINCLDWGTNGLSITVEEFFHFYKTNAENPTVNDKPTCSLEMPFNIVDISSIPYSPQMIAIMQRNCVVKIFDLEAQKIVTSFKDHGRSNMDEMNVKPAATACKSTGTKIVTSGIDGDVYIYDARSGSYAPIAKFHHDKPVSTIALSEDESYLAVALEDSVHPIVYNLRTHALFDPAEVTETEVQRKYSITTMAFGSNGDIYWGGSNGNLYCSPGITGFPRILPAEYGKKRIPYITSIGMPRASNHGYVSVTGFSNDILISNPGCNYWVSMIHVLNETNVV